MWSFYENKICYDDRVDIDVMIYGDCKINFKNIMVNMKKKRC